jgi:hypothetical protein
MIKLTQFVKGIDLMEGVVERLDADLRNRALKRTVQQATEMAYQQTTTNVGAKVTKALSNRQKDKPRLKEEIGEKLRQYMKGYIAFGIAGPKWHKVSDVQLSLLNARFVELGHKVVHGGTMALGRARKRGKGGSLVTRSGVHKNAELARERMGKGKSSTSVAPFPFVKPAFERSKAEFDAIFKRNVRDAIITWERREARALKAAERVKIG